LAKAIKIRAGHPEALVFNGATDLALRQTKKHEHFSCLLDLSGVDKLKFITRSKESWTIGSGTTMESLRIATLEKFPAIHEMLNVFASLQIRNLATIGGNIGSASPIGDLLPVLFAYKAQVKLISSGGERILPIEDFIKGYRSTDLHDDELIHSVIIPKPPAFAMIWTHKVSKRKDLDISTVSACFRIQTGDDWMISEAILAFGGMAATTQRAHKAERSLIGKAWNEDHVKTAAALIEQDFSPIADARSGKEFRTIVARNLLLKCYDENRELR
jgi:xanthine dehydrogenase iron-sulfur cluster and FAD-binding subunit A